MTLAARKILIVEDDPNILFLLEFLMGAEGFAVRSANTGATVLSIVETFTPDLILLDVMLPVLNGFELCQRLRAGDAVSIPKIILLTAKGREEEIARGLALGADAFVTKPFSTRELVNIVKQLLGA